MIESLESSDFLCTFFDQASKQQSGIVGAYPVCKGRGQADVRIFPTERDEQGIQSLREQALTSPCVLSRKCDPESISDVEIDTDATVDGRANVEICRGMGIKALGLPSRDFEIDPLAERVSFYAENAALSPFKIAMTSLICCRCCCVGRHAVLENPGSRGPRRCCQGPDMI